MKWFESETWKAFYPNFLAVVAGIVLTFGTDRIIVNLQHRNDIRNAVSVLKTDTRDMLDFFRGTALDECRRMDTAVNSVLDANGTYDTFPPQTLRAFLKLVMGRDEYASTSPAKDILKQSGVLQLMEPDILSLIDDIQLAQTSLENAVINHIREMEQIRMGLCMDSRKFPDALRDNGDCVAAVRFILEYAPCYNYFIQRPYADLAQTIDGECDLLEQALAELEAAGY